MQQRKLLFILTLFAGLFCLGRVDARSPRWWRWFKRPRPPAELMCTANQRDVFLSWKNRRTYAGIRVLRNGAKVAELKPGALAYSETVPETGKCQYQVMNVGSDGRLSRPRSCEITVAFVPPLSGVVCHYDKLKNETVLKWLSAGSQAFEAIRIFKNDVFLTELPQTATDYVDAGMKPGEYRYTLMVVAGGQVSDPVFCRVTAEPLNPISRLACVMDDMQCALNWTNNDAYDCVLVFCHDTLVAQLVGTETDYRHICGTPGVYSFKVTGTCGVQQTEPASCSVECEEPEPAPVPVIPVQLSGTASSATGDITLTWQSGGEYDQMELSCNQQLLATVSGLPAAYVHPFSDYGVFEFTAVGRQNGLAVGTGACSVTVSPLNPIASLSCVSDDMQCILNWTNGAVYDVIHVLCNDTLVGELAGTETAYQLEAETTGLYDFKVTGVYGVHKSAPAACAVDIQEPAPVPVTPVQLSGMVDAETGDVTLTWQNSGEYDQVEILCGDQPVATMPDLQTRYIHPFSSYGVFEFSAVGRKNGEAVGTGSCRVGVGRLICSHDDAAASSGFHVYVWAAGQSAPARENPGYTVQGMNMIVTLLELYEAGVLPASAEQSDFILAVSAFNASEISELSEAIPFSWKTDLMPEAQ